MKARAKVEWLVLTIAEPFPVFYSHVNVPKGQGPFYAAGSKRYVENTARNRAWAEFSKQHLARDGYTVTVSTEVR